MPERGPNSLFGVTMHEVNHALANREGFAAGSNPTAETNRLKSMYGSINDQLSAELNSPNPDQAKISRLRSALREVNLADPFNLYQRVAGEVDSRAVQERLNMTAPELNAVSPRQTVQSLVPFDRQIMRKWSFGARNYDAAGLDRIGKVYNPTSPRDYYVKQGDKFVNSTNHTWDDYTHRYNPSTGVMEPIQMTPEGKFVITGPGERP
jgi:hypothetical protein